MINVFYKRDTRTGQEQKQEQDYDEDEDEAQNQTNEAWVVSHFNAQIMSSFVGNMSNR